MPTPAQYKSPFSPECYYHVVFRSVDGVMLFHTDENRIYFLQKFSFYFKPVSTCLAYCLLENHVHFIIRVRSLSSLKENILLISPEAQTMSMKKFLENPGCVDIVENVLERQVNSFMVSYANAYNKRFSRKGNLFQSPFRRVEIKEDSHLQQAIIYVHANAQKHKFIKDFKDHRYNSYWEIIKGDCSNVQINEVLHFFGGKEQFIKIHQQQVDHFYNKGWPSSRLED
jgi:REP-associated tyrosine transposase